MNILIHVLTEILAYCKALKVKIFVHSNFPYRSAHSVEEIMGIGTSERMEIVEEVGEVGEVEAPVNKKRRI